MSIECGVVEWCVSSAVHTVHIGASPDAVGKRMWLVIGAHERNPPPVTPKHLNGGVRYTVQQQHRAKSGNKQQHPQWANYAPSSKWKWLSLIFWGPAATQRFSFFLFFASCWDAARYWAGRFDPNLVESSQVELSPRIGLLLLICKEC